MNKEFQTIHILCDTYSASDPNFSAFQPKKLSQSCLTLFPKDNILFSKGISDARKISKRLSNPLIWVSYSENSRIELRGFQNGKTICSYLLDERGIPFLEKIKNWSAILSLTSEEVSMFQWIGKHILSPKNVLELSSLLFGILLSQSLFPEWMPEDGSLFCKQPAQMNEWMRKQKASYSIFHHTHMKLCDEIPGIYGQQSGNLFQGGQILPDWDYGVIRISPPDQNGSFSYEHILCYMINDETFDLVYEYRYPKEIFDKNQKSLWLDYSHHDIMISSKQAVGNGNGQTLWGLYQKKLENLFTDYGKLPTHPLTKKFYFPHPATTPLQIDDFVYFYEHYDTPRLVQQKTDYSERMEYVLEKPDDTWSWGCEHQNFLSICEEQIILILTKMENSSRTYWHDILFFHRDLSLIRQFSFHPQKFIEQIDDTFLYHPQTDSIYYKGMAYNLQKQELLSSVPPVEGHLLNHLDARGNFILLYKNSTVCVMNPELKILSRHKLKGSILYYYENERHNLCFITSNESVYDWNIPKPDSAVRLYELIY